RNYPKAPSRFLQFHGSRWTAGWNRGRWADPPPHPRLGPAALKPAPLTALLRSQRNHANGQFVMASELTTTQSYQQLVADLAALLQKGQQDALNKLNEIRVRTYWEMGKRLSGERELIDSEQSGTFINRLAQDLNLDSTLLYRILQFYRTWPDAIPTIDNAGNLSWAHYVELISIKDSKERDFYLESATTEGWSRNTLRKAITKDLFTTSQNPTSETGQALKRDPSPLYTYKAIVEKVVDGDTLLVRIDLGFDVWVNQRIRFRGINTAELIKNGVPSGDASDRGEQAKQFVQEKLKDIEFIVIKTYKTDMYGRFVADVFYHPTIKKREDVAAKGFFLNLELANEGLADYVL
ncbi:MAG: hypothetical protein A3D98_00065, partial [Deltaproteobacteria bacterium RIFCSPHIGHO2_12_FULL_44_21]